MRDDVLPEGLDYFEDALPRRRLRVETYTNSDPNMLELETLSPLETLEPGEELEHTEHWFLHKGVSPSAGEAWVTEQIAPLAEQAWGAGPD